MYGCACHMLCSVTGLLIEVCHVLVRGSLRAKRDEARKWLEKARKPGATPCKFRRPFFASSRSQASKLSCSAAACDV